MLALPVFQFPTTIAWLDDDALFLKAATLHFGKNHVLKTFSHPKEALLFFENYTSPLAHMPFLKSDTEIDYYDRPNRSPVDFNIASLLELAKLPEKNQEISVIIVDFHMPELTGIELCKKLNGLPIKKILLTGEADNKEAVLAFNDNTIDRFVKKDDPNLTDTLQLYIETLTQQYFRERTQGLLAHLEADHLLPLSDIKFVDFFHRWCKENNIQAFYLIDNRGSFLTINDQGKTLHFIVHTEASLNNFVALYDEEPSIHHLLQQIKEKHCVPFFGTNCDPLQIAFDHWSTYCYPPNVFEGREKYYWTLVEAKN